MSDSGRKPMPKIFVVCDRSDTAPLWGYILRQQGLIAILETNIEKAVEHWLAEMPELLVIDIDVHRQDPQEFCRRFRAVSLAPILLFLPAYHETQILEAYAAGVDDVVVKPIDPPVVVAKLMAWLRRTWVMPTDALNVITAGRYRLVPVLRCLVTPNEVKIKLTNLEFRLLHLLMSRPASVFMWEEIIDSLWGDYGSGDHTLLKNVVYRLRRKIEPDPADPVVIRTMPGGYSFQG
jgi:DNA-binding response OmpR family regulator